jgi:hypothetical protein
MSNEDKKYCIGCKKEKYFNEFCRDKRKADGLYSICRKCHTKRYFNSEKNIERCREWRKNNPNYFKEWQNSNIEKYNNHLVRLRANNTVYSKKIKVKGCEICGDTSEKHHDDYSKPLQVRWLCKKHHEQLHSEIDLKIS